MCSYALLATYEAETLGSGGLEGDLAGVDIQGRGEGRAHLRNERSNFRRLKLKSAIDIGNHEALSEKKGSGKAEKFKRVDALISGVGIGEVNTDITKRSSTEERIAKGVDDNIPVGMGDKTQRMGNGDATEPQDEPFAVGTLRSEAVDVVSVTDSEIHLTNISNFTIFVYYDTD